MDFHNFLSLLNNECGYSEGENVLVALSGGADSMALVSLLHSHNIPIFAAHCNFNLRDEESDGDQQFVAEEMKTLGVHLFVRSFNTKEYAKQKGISIEMAARELRYGWFNELVSANDINWIATGHHKDDSIETFFLNLIRGTGIKGLTGIKPVSKNIIRPLLQYSRQQIETYCTANKILYRTDSSNTESVYTRNKIRNEILPLFNNINPSFQNTMEENIRKLNQVRNYVQNTISEIKDKLIVEQDNQLLVSLKHVEEFEDKELVLFEILHPYGFNSTLVREIVTCINQQVSGKQFFSNNFRLIKDRFNLILLPLQVNINEGPFFIDIDDDKIDNPIQITIENDIEAEGYKIERNSKVGQFDCDLLSFPLTLRRWKQGDSFKPLGMNHFKKLSDFFIDNKFSIKDKEDTWLLLSGDDIIWVVGYRTDDRYKVNVNTKKVTKLTVN